MRLFAIALVGLLASDDSLAQVTARQRGMAGSYAIFLCKQGPCRWGDTASALTFGTLVLNDTDLVIDHRVDSLSLLDHWGRPGELPNACFVLRPPARGAQTYAGIGGVGLTRWGRPSTDAITFGLYASPDAGHGVRLVTHGDTLRGRGGSWGAGVAEVHYPSDTVLAVRLGPPDPRICIAAAGQHWRAIRERFKRPPNEQLLPSAPLSEAAGSLRSPAAFFMIAPQQNCGR